MQDDDDPRYHAAAARITARLADIAAAEAAAEAAAPAAAPPAAPASSSGELTSSAETQVSLEDPSSIPVLNSDTLFAAIFRKEEQCSPDL